MNILAVIVTYNRKDLLNRCIDYLESQSDKPNEIIVINNGSTDDTVKMLEERNINYITQPNVGSAGGWKLGIDYALKKNFDACWLMDDDGYPDKNALRQLKKNFSSDLACVSSVVVNEINPTSFVFPFPVLNKEMLPVIFGFPRKFYTLQSLKNKCPNNTYSFAHLFNGALISVNAIKKIGNVNSNFFLMGDEVDYFFRLRKYGQVLTVLDALHYHPDVTKRSFSLPKIYYYIKNSIILNKKYFNYPYIRHLIILIAILLRVFARNGFKDFISLLVGFNARYFYKAIYNGISNKIGHDLDK